MLVYVGKLKKKNEESDHICPQQIDFFSKKMSSGSKVTMRWTTQWKIAHYLGHGVRNSPKILKRKAASSWEKNTF